MRTTQSEKLIKMLLPQLKKQRLCIVLGNTAWSLTCLTGSDVCFKLQQIKPTRMSDEACEEVVEEIMVCPCKAESKCVYEQSAEWICKYIVNVANSKRGHNPPYRMVEAVFNLFCIEGE